MNARGEVIGVTTLMLRGGQNLNYAVPVRYVRPLADSKEPPRRYAHEFLPTTDRGLAALGAGPEGRRSSRSARDRSTRDEDVIGRQFELLDSLVETRGGESASDLVRGSLDRRGTAEHAVTLIGGHEYVIAGGCDEDCSDLDLGIKDPAGRVLDVDAKDNDYPFLRFRVRTPGNYTLTVSMSGCAVEPCAYGIRLYRF